MSRFIIVEDIEPETPAADADEEILSTAPTGPTRPIGARAPDSVDRLPTSTQTETRTGGRYWYLSAHGGAGQSTLAALDPNGADARGHWPAGDVVLVARETATGLVRLQHALRHWSSRELEETPGVNLLGVITIPGAPGRPPKPVRDDLRRIIGGAPRHWEIGWETKLLAARDPTTAPTPGGLRKVTRTIAKISNEGATP